MNQHQLMFYGTNHVYISVEHELWLHQIKEQI